MKFWAKTIKDNKISTQTVWERDGRINWAEMHDYMTEIAYQLDIPTPIVIKTHLFNFAKFNHVKFLKSDFVEKIDFDYLLVENISDV